MRPQRWYRIGVVRGEQRLQRGDFLRLLDRKVVPFARISSKIEQPDLFLIAIDVQLPVARAHHPIGSRLPEDRVVLARHRTRAKGGGHDVDPVNHPIARQGHASGGSEGGEQIDMGDRRIDDRARRNPLWPFDEHRHADAAFEQCDLPPAIRCVDLGYADIARRAIIAAEHHDGVVGQPLGLQLVHHPPDAAIHCADHRGIDPLAMRSEFADRVEIRLGRL